MEEIELPPREKYLHYVTLPKNHNLITWSFSTSRKSITFGLYRQLPTSISSTNLAEVSSYSNDSVHSINYISPQLESNSLSKKKSKKHLSLTSWPNKSEILQPVADEDVVRTHSYSKTNEETTLKPEGRPSISSSLKPPSINMQFQNGNRKNKSVSTSELQEIIPPKTYEAYKSKIKGEYHVEQPDNSQSWSTSKKITFFVTTSKAAEEVKVDNSPVISGWVLKKKRKKMQGWAKRWCSIAGGNLSYSKDSQSVIRGSIPMALAVITFDYDTLIVIIDSGSSLYRFKFLNETDFQAWEKVILTYMKEGDEPGPVSGLPDLEEMPESENEEGNAPLSAISKSISIRKSILNNKGDVQLALSASKCGEIESGLNELSGAFECIAKKIESLLPAENLNGVSKNETVKDPARDPEVSRSTDSIPTLGFFSDQEALDTIRNNLTVFRTKKAALEVLIREESQQRQKIELAYINSISETNKQPNPRASVRNSNVVSNGNSSNQDVSITFQADTNTSNRRSFRRRSVYSRRQASIASLSSIGGGDDQFFDALDSVDTYNSPHSSEMDADSVEGNDEVDSNDSEDDSSKSSPNLDQPSQPENQPTDKEQVEPVKEVFNEIVRRRELPSPVCGDDVSFLAIMRKNVGKDLSTVSLPVSLNEPLNILQRLCEELEYCDLLDKAATSPNAMERLLFVTAFAVSPLASSGHRASRKPFNPLLGETYECIRPDKGFQFIAEKVSHTPPIFACYAESENYIFHQDSRPKSKFWGKSMELISAGTTHVQLPKTNDHFVFNKPIGCMRNIVGGTRYLEYTGEIKVTNLTTGDYCKVVFKESTFFQASNNELKATLHDKKGQVLHMLEGQWNHSLMWVKSPDQLEVVWKANALPPNAQANYSFTQFALELNELTPDLDNLLPTTDTRLRPDQRLFEMGDVPNAESEKTRIEEEQRVRRREREAANIPYHPKWFHLTEQIGYDNKKSEAWTYKGGYFEARQQKGFGELPKIW